MRRNSCSVPCSWELVALKQTYSDADEFQPWQIPQLRQPWILFSYSLLGTELVSGNWLNKMCMEALS